jgi:hypothetical protein
MEVNGVEYDLSHYLLFNEYFGALDVINNLQSSLLAQ